MRTGELVGVFAERGGERLALLSTAPFVAGAAGVAVQQPIFARGEPQPLVLRGARAGRELPNGVELGGDVELFLELVQDGARLRFCPRPSACGLRAVGGAAQQLSLFADVPFSRQLCLLVPRLEVGARVRPLSRFGALRLLGAGTVLGARGRVSEPLLVSAGFWSGDDWVFGRWAPTYTPEADGCLVTSGAAAARRAAPGFLSAEECEAARASRRRAPALAG
jgi:hypothetical protein